MPRWHTVGLGIYVLCCALLQLVSVAALQDRLTFLTKVGFVIHLLYLTYAWLRAVCFPAHRAWDSAQHVFYWVSLGTSAFIAAGATVLVAYGSKSVGFLHSVHDTYPDALLEVGHFVQHYMPLVVLLLHRSVDCPFFAATTNLTFRQTIMLGIWPVLAYSCYYDATNVYGLTGRACILPIASVGLVFAGVVVGLLRWRVSDAPPAYTVTTA
jgi:hypothetical protein